MQLRLLTTLLLLSTLSLQSQTFSGTGGHIPDDGSSVDFEIAVGGLPNVMDTLAFGLQGVCLNITHTWSADLAVSVIAPDGTVLLLFSNLGGDTDGFVNTCLSGNAGSSIFQQWYPFTGTFRPFGDMGNLNIKGINPNGVWKLHILDTYAFADEGDLLDWNISFGSQPCKPFPFQSSDLPIMKVNTGGNIILNDPKIDAQLQLIDNGPGVRNYLSQTNYAFEGKIGVELRGVSSQGFPKKSYGIEVRDDLGEDQEVSLLGLPKTSDFALLANFSDKTLMRNALAYEMFRQLGHYATRTRFCELVLDNTYQGVYILTEKIKRGKERVDIARLKYEDTTGTALSGGYMLRIDWNTSPGWNSPFSQPNSPTVFTYFQHVYPKWDEMHPLQTNYIRAYVDSFEQALRGPAYQDTSMGWRRFADERTFIDYLILNEISKNVDGYRLSTYFYKDKGGKIQMGPPWDYDLAWYNADYCENFQTSGWAYDINYICADAGVPFWWEKLAADTLFAQNLACRWQSLRNGSTLSKAHIFGVIDSMAAVLQEAQGRNFKYWPILGQYVWPNPGPLPTTYPGEVAKMKNWLSSRLNWLDFAILQKLPQLDATFTASAINALNWQFTAKPGYHYAWDFGDGSTSNDAAPQHQFPGPGTYTVKLKVNTPYGCSKGTEQVIHIVNSAVGSIVEGQIQVSPNPAHDVLQVTLPNNFETAGTFRLINTLGQTVLDQQFSGNGKVHSLHLISVPKGPYIIQVQTASSKSSIQLSIQ